MYAQFTSYVYGVYTELKKLLFKVRICYDYTNYDFMLVYGLFKATLHFRIFNSKNSRVI